MGQQCLPVGESSCGCLCPTQSDSLFSALSCQVEGMVHVSNLSKRPVSSAKDVVQRGMQV